MSRTELMISEEAAWAAVDSSIYGTLALLDEQGIPYAVPLSFWRQGKNLYFHCGKDGRKIRGLRAHSRVSVSFVAQAEVLPRAMSVRYTSALCWGQAEEVTDPEEKAEALRALCLRYQVPADHPAFRNGFRSCMPATGVWRIRVDSVTGKHREN